LEGAGLIEREACEIDRRGAFAAITDEGIEMLDSPKERLRQRMWSVYCRGIERYFACHLDPTEAKLLVKILDRMTLKGENFNHD
jgi:DNA-binding MarR family transcriptional regulator